MPEPYAKADKGSVMPANEFVKGALQKGFCSAPFFGARGVSRPPVPAEGIGAGGSIRLPAGGPLHSYAGKVASPKNTGQNARSRRAVNRRTARCRRP